MERKFFTWRDYDVEENGAGIVFYDCTLARDLGPWRAGDVLDRIIWDLNLGKFKMRKGRDDGWVQVPLELCEEKTGGQP